VGFESDVTADTFTIFLESSDTYFLCSDGLSGMVSDKDISRIFSSRSLAGAVERLVAEANQNGGEDNITVIALNCKNGTGGSTLVRRKPRRQRKQTPRKRSEKF
jgi:protein phosphatase